MRKRSFFCPEVGGKCIGPNCIAYGRGLNMPVDISIFPTRLVKRLISQGFLLEDLLAVTLDVGFCDKFGKVVDNGDTLKKFQDFLKEREAARHGRKERND